MVLHFQAPLAGSEGLGVLVPPAAEAREGGGGGRPAGDHAGGDQGQPHGHQGCFSYDDAKYGKVYYFFLKKTRWVVTSAPLTTSCTTLTPT